MILPGKDIRHEPVVLLLLICLLGPSKAGAQVLAPQKISQSTGDARGNITTLFNLVLPAYNDPFLVDAGDIDGDGFSDFILETYGNEGWVLFINEDGSIKNYFRNGRFRQYVLPLGDVNGDGIPDVATGNEILFLDRSGAVKSATGITDVQIESPKAAVDVNVDGVTDIVQIPQVPGAGSKIITIHFLNGDRTVARTQRICNYENADGSGCNEGNLSREKNSNWGDVTALGDLDGNGVPDLAVGAPFDELSPGLVWILFLDFDGTVIKDRLIDPTEDWFTGVPSDTLFFGRSVAGIGDLDGDGIPDMAAGADRDDDGGRNRGAIWILFLDEDGAVKDSRKISSLEGGFEGALHNGDRFGGKLLSVDIEGDGGRELVVAAPGDEGAGGSAGAWWTLWLDQQGWVQKHHKSVATDFLFFLDDDDRFGRAQASPGDLDGDGLEDLLVGAPGDDDGGADGGAAWILYLNEAGKTTSHRKISAADGILSATLFEGDHFGSAVTSLNETGKPHLVVGAPGDDGGGVDRGAVYVLPLETDGSITSVYKISSTGGRLDGRLGDYAAFGSAVSPAGDADGDGVEDLFVGAPGDNGQGAVWLLYLDGHGSVRADRKITTGGNGFTGILSSGDRFGASVLGRIDVDGDSVDDLVVGAPGDDGRGTLWILFLDRAGSVSGHTRITTDESGFGDVLHEGDYFGSAVSSPGDLDDDGVSDLLVGADGDSDGHGAVYILFLNADGTVKSRLKISPTDGPFAGQIDAGDGFGISLSSPGGSENPRVVAGTYRDDDGGSNRGAVWLFSVDQVLSPEISDLTLTPTLVEEGNEIHLSTHISGNLGVAMVQVSYRVSGWNQFATANMLPAQADTYTFTVPGWDVTDRGFEFFIVATNDIGGSARLPTSGVFSIPVYLSEGLQTSVSSGSEASAYRLVSVPIDLDERSAKIVLEDDLGSYHQPRWRFFDVQAGSGTFLELDTNNLEMIPGKAFWLIVRDEGRTITTGAGTSVPTDSAYPIPVDEGWNLVGNPYNFPIPLTNVRLESSNETPVLRFYEGAWNDILEAPVDTLWPFEGYALMSSEPDRLQIDPDLSADFGPAGANKAAISWSIRIRARSGNARDEDNLAIVTPDASIGKDRMDHPEPPLIGDYVSVSFPHEDWAIKSTRFSTDARPVPDSTTYWTFEVTTREAGMVTLDFDGLASVPEEYDVWLVDSLLQIRQDLRAFSQYTVASSGKAPARNLTIVAGKKAHMNGIPPAGPANPYQFKLYQSFPNPFSTVTTFRYALPEACLVRLTLYDVVGRQVRVLTQEQKPEGYHAAVWDGRNDAGIVVASGIYFARMQAGTYVETQSMVLLR